MVFLSTLSLRRATRLQGPLMIWYGYFYPRSPCGERQLEVLYTDGPAIFLSTLSLRRATADVVSVQYRCQDFYPRSPCGERRPCHGRLHQSRDYFYPRSPCGERPLRESNCFPVICISIHALLAESDRWSRIFLHPRSYFYPRSPCGERQTMRRAAQRRRLFLSTLSLRRATAVADLGKGYIRISIHALLAESDC